MFVTAVTHLIVDCTLFTPCIFLYSVFIKINKMHQLKYNKIYHKTHFISGVNSYMFQHQGAIIRECISNKGLYVLQALFALTSIIKVKSLRMLQLQTTHQPVHVHTVITPPHSDEYPRLHNYSRLFFLGCAHKHPYQYMIQRDLVV